MSVVLIDFYMMTKVDSHNQWWHQCVGCHHQLPDDETALLLSIVLYESAESLPIVRVN